jgi:hypothetical protein
MRLNAEDFDFTRPDPLRGDETAEEIKAKREEINGQPNESIHAEDEPEQAKLPAFPQDAWRGLFADYREAMSGATEANDGFHFAALWARCAVALGRSVQFPYGMPLFPNVFLVGFGATGDRKTSATRRALDLGCKCKIVYGGGSGEGLADEFASTEPGKGLLLYAEEFSQILRPGSWQGSTLIPFLTQCFDCPPRYEMKFRKSPVVLDQPTPTVLAGTTPEWFWRDFQAREFQGGFGNRIFFFTGKPKGDIPLPKTPDLTAVSQAVDELALLRPCVSRFDSRALELWKEFYHAWRKEEKRRDPLLQAAVQRIPAYTLKLTMTYSALEQTLPKMTFEQLGAAVQVSKYGEGCAKELLSLQCTGTNQRKELERRILGFVCSQPRRITTKREIYRALARHYSDTEAFNRAFDSLVRAGELFTQSERRGSVRVSQEPME